MSVARAARAVVGALGGLLLGYILYAHATQAIVAREYRKGTDLRRFGVADDLAGLEVRSNGLEPHFDGGRMRIHGAPPAAATVSFLGSERRLDPSQIVRLRFRIRTPEGGPRAPVDVAVRLETSRGDRHVEIAMRDGPGPALFRIHGDRSATSRTEPLALTLSETDARTHVADRDGEHDLALRFEADPRLIVPVLDGVPLPAVGESGWLAGTLVRPWIGVRAREGGVPVDVEILEMESRVVPDHLATPLRFEEDFKGAVLDPARWTVLAAGPGLADLSLAPGAGGLHLRGTSRQAQGFQLGFLLRGPTFPFDDLDLRATFTVRSLVRSALVIGVGAEWVMPWFFEVGLVDAPAGDGGGPTLVPFCHGTFRGGQAGFETFPPPPGFDPRAPIEVGFSYDRASRTARFRVNGAKIVERALELLPYEEVRLKVGANFQEPGASFDAVATALALRREN